MIVNLHVDVQRKLKYLREHQKSLILVRTLMLILLVIHNVQKCFFNKIQPMGLNIIKPWSVTHLSNVESLRKIEFAVNNNIKSKFSLSQGGDISKINAGAIVNAANETLDGGY